MNDETATAAEEVVRLPVDALVIAGSPRAAGEDDEHVWSLVAADQPLPPIIVHRASMRVIDGAHRLRAARLRGLDHIDARFFDGSEADAFVLAVRANIAHGLPLALADRTAAAARIVRSHPQWSDRAIASVAGIAARTVAEIRRRHGDPPPPDGVRIGQDGRARPVDGARRRTLASALLTENPDLSLRQVAQVAGISPETVRDVRNRLLYGRKPAPSRAADVVEDRGTIVKRLTADPALRHTDTGRALLRVLQLHAMADESWEKILDNVPTHCAELVVRAARDCARRWTELADRLAERSTDIS